MKNLIATTAAVTALFAGTAAFAEGGLADSAPVHENANATVQTQEVSDRGKTREVSATVFVSDVTAASNGLQGR